MSTDRRALFVIIQDTPPTIFLCILIIRILGLENYPRFVLLVVLVFMQHLGFDCGYCTVQPLELCRQRIGT